MKKLIHILTIRDHRKMMVEPGRAWYKEVNDRKYYERFTSSVSPGKSYGWHVYDGGEHIVDFNNSEDCFRFAKQKNAEFPPPPKPPEPPPPFPYGTYYMLEARYFEIRQLVKHGKGSVGETFIAEKYDQPYHLAWGWFGGQDHPTTWEEKFIAKYDDREEALAHLRELVLKH